MSDKTLTKEEIIKKIELFLHNVENWGINLTAREIYSFFNSISTKADTNADNQDELWDEAIKLIETNQFLSTKYKEVIRELKSKYHISKK